MSKNDPENIKVLEDRYQDLHKEYNKKFRKLQKCKRAAKARAYVQQRLKEEAEQRQAEKHQALNSCKPIGKSGGDEHDRGGKSTHLRSTAQKSRDLCNDKYKLSVPQQSRVTENLANDLPVTRVGLLGKTVIKIPKQSASTVAASKTKAPVEVGCKDNIGDENQEVLDISAESQDIFISPLKPVDKNKTTCLHAQTDIKVDTDPVIIIPGHEEQARNTNQNRHKSYVSKLKLSKYKKKNFVNPVRDEHLNDTYRNTESLNVDPENIHKLGSDDLQGDVVDCVKSFDGSKTAFKNVTAEVCDDLCIEIQNAAQVQGDAKIQDHVLAKEQGTIYSEGQVIVFERQVISENKENRQKKSNVKIHRKREIDIINQKRLAASSVDTSLTCSETQSTSESSTVLDNDLLNQCEDNIKIRRRSGSRKRRSSGQGVQRRSSRLSGQSSEESWSQSAESEVISPLFLNSGQSSTKKRVIISSVFQCLVDEGRRKSVVEEFCVPSDFVKGGLKENYPKSRTRLPDFAAESYAEDIDTSEKVERELIKTSKSEFEESDKGNTESIKVPEPDTENCASNLEKEELDSPTLFESQSDCSAFKFTKEKEKNERKVSDSTEQQESEIGIKGKKDNCDTEYNVSSQGNNGIHCKDTGIKESCIRLQQTACFQVPKSDHVQSVLCVEAVCNDQTQPYVVCLCSSCLKLYTVCNSQWTCVATSKLGYISRKKSGSVMYCLPDTDTVSVVVLGVQSDCTCINLYTYAQQEWQHKTLDKIFSKSTSIQVCPLSHQYIVVSYHTDEMTYLCKYSLDIDSGQWSSKQLDRTDRHITQLVAVKGIDAAVLAVTKSAEVQIWNHEYGYLLSTVDMSDVCPLDPVCPLAFAEQGFLFLPLLTKKKSSGPGSVVVINPFIGVSEALTPINIQDIWTGCSNTCIMSHGLLLGRQNNGCVRVWNVYTGSLLATVDDVSVTCFSAANQHFAIAHKQCIHLYKLNVPSLSKKRN